MTSMEFHDIAQRNGFYQNGKAAYGYLNGYPVSMSITKVRMGAAMKDGVKAVFLTEGALQASDIQNINAQYKGNGVTLTVPVSGNIEVTFPYTQNEAYAVGEQVFYAITSAMNAAGVRVKERCAVCGQENCDQIVLQGDKYVPVHSDCLANNAGTVNTKSNQGNMAMGVLGAFIGAIVGALPTIFTVYAFDYILYILVMLIPLASYQGYKMAKGPKTQIATVLATVFSFLSLILVLVAAISGGYGVPFFEAFRRLVHNMTLDFGGFVGALFSSIGMGMLFLVFGVVSVAGQVSKDAQTAPQTSMQRMSAVPVPRVVTGVTPAPQAFPGVEQGYTEDSSAGNTPFPPVI